MELTKEEKAVGENIHHAFELVRESHRQIEKLLDAIDEVGSTTDYENLTKGFFLRYNSDKNRWGWLYSSFIKVFAPKKDSSHLYSIEINFDKNELGQPRVIVGTHFYKKGSAAKKLYPPLGWIFMHRRDPSRGFEIKQEEDGSYISKPDFVEKKEHQGLLEFKYSIFPLLSLKRNNIKSLIFDRFEKNILNS